MDQLAYDFRRTFSGSKEEKALSFDAFQVVLRKSHDEQSNDLFKSIKVVLAVGRILGVIPISGVFKQSHTQLSFRKASLAFVISSIITGILTFNLVLALNQWAWSNKRNAYEIAKSIHRTAQYCWGWIM